MKLIALCAWAVLLAPFALAVEHVTAVHGTISKVDAATKTIVLKAADGTEHTLRLVARTAVHGTEAASRDAFHGLKEGQEVVAHYTRKGAEETAVEVDRVGKDGMKAADGTVSELDRRSKKLVMKTANGAEQEFQVTDRAVEEAGRDLGEGSEKSARVTVYYTENAGKKIAHFFESR